MIARNRRLNLVLSLIVIFSMVSATAGQAATANAPSRASPAQPELAPPPGRNGLGMGQAENGNPADAPIHLVDGVNVTNGNLLVSDLHAQINALGLPFGLQVAYNAQAGADLNSYTPLGRKWTHSLNWYVAVDPLGSLAVHKGDGEVITYPLSCRQDVNRSGGPIDVLDIQLDAEAWNTVLGDPGFESFFDVALPLDNRVDIRDVQVVSAAFNLTCNQVASAYWLWNENPADRVYSEIVQLPNGEIQMHTREGIIYVFFAPTPPGPAAGKLQGIWGPNGSNITLAYNAGGLLTTATGTSGATLQFAYNTSACAVPVIASVTDHVGRMVTYQYGSGCNLTGVERYGVPWHSYVYGPGSLLTSDTNALGHTTSYSYDGSQRVTALQRPATPAQTYNYATPGATVVTDAVGRVTRYQYSLNSKISQVQQVDSGLTVAYAYDARGNLAHLGGANGNDYQYDDRGNLTRIESAHPDPVNPTRLETLFTYDLCNQVVTTIDAMGRLTTNSYDPGTCFLTGITESLGNTTTFINNPQGQPGTIIDALGQVTSNSYGANGNLIATTDHGGNTTLMDYDLLNRKVSETDAAGFVTGYEYDLFDRQTRIIAPNGGETSMIYDALGNLLSATNPDGHTTAYSYDAAGNKIAVTDALGNVTAYSYDPVGRLVRVTEPLGRVTQIEYDPMDRPVRVRANALSPSPQVTTIAYDDPAFMRSITNARGETTTFHLDGADRVTRVVNPDGSQIQYEYNLAGELVSVVDALGREEASEYDAVGRKVADIDALGNITEYVYDAVGNLRQVINANSQTTLFDYDYQGRMTQVVDPLGGVAEIVYDARGNTTAIANADGQTTTFAYDNNGNMSQVVNPLGEATLLGHSAAGLPVVMQSPRGQAISFQLDSLGRVVSETRLGPDGLLATVSFTYDAAGNRTSMTDANGEDWLYAYDDLGRLAAATDPLGNTTTYTYDALGNLTQKQLPNACIVDYSYDSLNRLVRTGYSDGSYVLQNYDAMGNVTLVETHGSGPAGVVSSASFAYDDRNRVIQLSGTITPALSYDIAYTYDALGNPVHKTYTLPGATSPVEIAQAWDAANRLVSIARSEGTETVGVEKTYTPGGRLSTVQASSNGLTAAYSRTLYDAAGRVTEIQHCTTPACTTVLSRFSYSYDADGNRIMEQVLKDSTLTNIHTDVDGLGRLAHELRLPVDPAGPPAYDVVYTYDAVGNRLSSHDLISNRHTETSYDAAHRTSEVTEYLGGVPVHSLLYLYDPAGNLAHRHSTLVQPPAQPVDEHFQYDCEGRLVGYQDPLNGVQQATLYDGLGNKIVTAGTAGDTAYVYDGPNVAAEYSLADPSLPALETTYLFGQEIDEPLARIDAATLDPAYYLKDALGSTRQIVDQVSAVRNDYEYRAFGELWTQVTGLPNDILFTGRQLDPASQLYDFRTRAYDPTDGRFLQPDPIYQGLILVPCVGCWQNPLELMEVMPLYAYVGNNPTTYTDPTGEQWWFWHPWWWLSGPVDAPYGWWGWWHRPWGWSGLRWWWWRWWWPANPWWGGWWWWNWRWWWGGWWFGWWGNLWWPWWYWNMHWWYWPWWTGWGWWWYPWWWGGWYWPWWWFHWRGWWHWWWHWPFKWGWWCGWWFRWWWPWWWNGWWWPWGWLNWAGWRLPFWLGWGWWWWPWWWGGFWWPWWFGWGWWPWWGGWLWWNWWSPWWRPWYWGVWWWGPWRWYHGWHWWPGWWGRFWWPRWWWCGWSLRPWWWHHWWVWRPWWRPWWYRWWWGLWPWGHWPWPWWWYGWPWWPLARAAVPAK